MHFVRIYSLGHATILRKGRYDVISDGHHAILVQHGGSPRRVGGQGDVLSGAVGVCDTRLDNESMMTCI